MPFVEDARGVAAPLPTPAPPSMSAAAASSSALSSPLLSPPPPSASGLVHNAELAASASPAPLPYSLPQPLSPASTAASDPAPLSPSSPSSPPPFRPDMLQHLPEDVQNKLLSLLPQRDLGVLSTSCKALNSLTAPLLHRRFRCSTCRHALFHPRHLQPSPRESRPRRAFLELRADASHSMELDGRRGAANFHVLRHLAQTVFRNVRFPLPAEVRAVRALRCPACAVFVGFRHDGVSGSPPRQFVHHDFVELVDARGNVVTRDGIQVPPPKGVVQCADADCLNELFSREDVMPWSHVLSSTRLTDMDAYLEWDHSWSGAATASHPAFFVRRVRDGAVSVRNVRNEHLRQGLMSIGDVHCAKCDAHIGWKFLDELVEATGGLLQNYDQIGRFGIIRAAVTPSEPRHLT